MEPPAFSYFYDLTKSFVNQPGSSKNYAVYQHFNRKEDLEAVAEILRLNNIPVRTSDNGDGFGEWTEGTILGAPLRPKFWIEIPEHQFEKANFMLQEAAEADLEEEDLNVHPFNEYSVADLQQVLVEESKWSPEAVVVARRLLLRRGKDVDLKRLRDASRARLAEDFLPLHANPLLISFLTVLAAVAGFMVWIVGIMLVLGIVLYYAVGSRRDPKGARHDAYDHDTRKRSRIALGVLIFATALGLVNMLYLKWITFPDIDGWLWWWR